jgi:hypothetical protein
VSWEFFKTRPEVIYVERSKRLNVHGEQAVPPFNRSTYAAALDGQLRPHRSLQICRLTNSALEVRQFLERVKYLQPRPSEILVIARYNRQIVTAGGRGDITLLDRHCLAGFF